MKTQCICPKCGRAAGVTSAEMVARHTSRGGFYSHVCPGTGQPATGGVAMWLRQEQAQAAERLGRVPDRIAQANADHANALARIEADRAALVAEAAALAKLAAKRAKLAAKPTADTESAQGDD